MNYLRVKNWGEFQHYKDRNPPWIKLHRTLLDDYEFSCLQDASKAHLMLIWLFASQCDGRIPDDPKFLQKKLGLNSLPDLKSFKDHGLLIPEQDASKPLALVASNLRLETEAYKEETYKTAEKEKPSAPDASRRPLKVEFDFSEGAFKGITEDAELRWQEAYPAVPIPPAIAQAAAWLKANPANKKSNYERFLVNWFSRSQDKAARVRA